MEFERRVNRCFGESSPSPPSLVRSDPKLTHHTLFSIFRRQYYVAADRPVAHESLKRAMSQ